MAIEAAASTGPVEDFEARTWQQALEDFRNNSGHVKEMDSFLRKTTTPTAVAQTCRDKQREADSKYGKLLSRILGKIDIFITIGNVAVKGAPESVGLAWTAVQMALHAVQDDYATFQLFTGACVDIIGILITCRLFGRMFSAKDGPPDLYEIQTKVLDAIPAVYSNILEFSYRMMKFIGSNTMLRLMKGAFTANKTKFTELIGTVNAGEKAMSVWAQKATNALQLHYAKKTDLSIGTIASDLGSIKEMIDRNAESSREVADLLRKELEAAKRRTPMDVARETFSAQQKRLAANSHVSQFEARLERREPNTCTWLFDTEEYQQWRSSSSDSRFLWMTGGGNIGKSFLVSSLIERLRSEAAEDEGMFVHYFFCKNGDNDAQKTERILAQILGTLYAATPQSLETLDRCNDIVRRFLLQTGTDAKNAAGAGVTHDKEVDTSEKSMAFEEAYAALAGALKKKVYLVVDALDEIADRKEGEPIQRLMKATIAAKDLRIFVSSRPDPQDILELLEKSEYKSRIRVEKYNEADIKKAVESQLQRIPGLSTQERDEAAQIISARASQYFGYIEPAMALLRQPWQRPLRKHLEQLPENVLEMNLKRLADTDPRYLGFLKTCLTWAIFANGDQKITVEEVVDAYSRIYTAGDIDFSDQDDTDTAGLAFYREQIHKAADAFLEVDAETGELSLIKPAIVKDSFVKKHTSNENGTLKKVECDECQRRHQSSSVFTLTEKEGHMEVAHAIFDHLNSPAFIRRFLPWHDKEETTDEPNASEEPTTNGVNGDASQDGNVDHLADATDSSPIDTGVTPINGVDNSGAAAAGELSDDVAVATEIAPDTSADSPQISDGVSIDQTVDATQESPEAEESGDDAKSPDQDEAVEDDLESEGDSDAGEPTWPDHEIPSGDGKEAHTRYEILQCCWHLQEVQALWSNSGVESSEYDELLTKAVTFFSEDNPAFKSWRLKLAELGNFPVFWGTEKLETLTPVHITASYGLYDLTKRLLARGDAPDERDKNCYRPLAMACWLLSTHPGKLKTCELLLEAGASPNMVPMPLPEAEQLRSYWNSPFYILLCTGDGKDHVQLFLDHCAMTIQADEDGFTPLHMFANYGTDRDVLALLLSHGADINFTDHGGKTPLHKLLERADLPIEILQDFLDAGADISWESDESRQPLYEAASNGNVEAARIVLAHGADVNDDAADGGSAIHAAASNGKSKMVELLIQHGADCTRIDNEERSPFFLACDSGDIETARFLAAECKKRDHTLLDKPARNGKTPFRKACAGGHIEVVRMLLEELGTDININATDVRLGRNAVHVAAYIGADEILDLLLSHEADADTLDKKGESALSLCYKTWTYKGKDNASNPSFEKCLTLLININGKRAATDPDLLTTVAKKGCLPILKLLLENGADPNSRDHVGWTALEVARQYKQHEIEKVLASYKGSVKVLPSRWKSTDSRKISVSEDGITARYVCDMKARYAGRFTVLSDIPIPAGVSRYYYEVTLSVENRREDDEPSEIAVGISHPEFAAKTCAGWLPGHFLARVESAGSWGYHGDDGSLLSTLSYWTQETRQAEGYSHGDTIGCGVDLNDGYIFWTRNGKRLMDKAHENVSGRIYPAIGASDSCEFATNFGPQGFKWDPANSLDFEADLGTAPESL